MPHKYINNKCRAKSKLYFKFLFSLKILGLTNGYFMPPRSIFFSDVNRGDIRRNMHKYQGREKSLQIRILHVHLQVRMTNFDGNKAWVDVILINSHTTWHTNCAVSRNCYVFKEKCRVFLPSPWNIATKNSIIIWLGTTRMNISSSGFCTKGGEINIFLTKLPGCMFWSYVSHAQPTESLLWDGLYS